MDSRCLASKTCWHIPLSFVSYFVVLVWLKTNQSVCTSWEIVGVHCDEEGISLRLSLLSLSTWLVVRDDPRIERISTILWVLVLSTVFSHVRSTQREQFNNHEVLRLSDHDLDLEHGSPDKPGHLRHEPSDARGFRRSDASITRLGGLLETPKILVISHLCSTVHRLEGVPEHKDTQDWPDEALDDAEVHDMHHVQRKAAQVEAFHCDELIGEIEPKQTSCFLKNCTTHRVRAISRSSTVWIVGVNTVRFLALRSWEFGPAWRTASRRVKLEHLDDWTQSSSIKMSSERRGAKNTGECSSDVTKLPIAGADVRGDVFDVVPRCVAEKARMVIVAPRHEIRTSACTPWGRLRPDRARQRDVTPRNLCIWQVDHHQKDVVVLKVLGNFYRTSSLSSTILPKEWLRTCIGHASRIGNSRFCGLLRLNGVVHHWGCRNTWPRSYPSSRWDRQRISIQIIVTFLSN